MIQTNMGNGKYLVKSGGFSSYYYVSRGTITAHGITAKIITWYNTKDFHESLPRYSNTSKYYVKLDKHGNIIQLRVLENRRAVYDFDWSHRHGDMPKGVVHVHQWKYDSKGNLIARDSPRRFMNNDEIRKFGKFIKHVNPNAKLRKGRGH